jgi:hypothetical protein
VDDGRARTAAGYSADLVAELEVQREYMERLKQEWNIPKWQGPYCGCPDWRLGSCGGPLVYAL